MDGTNTITPESETENETARVLRRAAEIVRERGLCQCRFEDDKGRVCFMGAINAAKNGRAGFVPRWNWETILGAQLFNAIGGETGIIQYVAYNNTPGRTAAEVSDMLLRASRIAGERG